MDPEVDALGKLSGEHLFDSFHHLGSLGFRHMGVPGIVDLFLGQVLSGDSQKLLHLGICAQPGGFPLLQRHMPHAKSRVCHDPVRVRQLLSAVFEFAFPLLLFQLFQTDRRSICLQNDTVFGLRVHRVVVKTLVEVPVRHIHFDVYGVRLPDLKHLKNGLQIHRLADPLAVGFILGQGGNDLRFKILPIGSVLDLREDIPVLDHTGIADGHIIHVTGDIGYQVELLGKNLSVDGGSQLLRVVGFLGDEDNQVACQRMAGHIRGDLYVEYGIVRQAGIEHLTRRDGSVHVRPGQCLRIEGVQEDLPLLRDREIRRPLPERIGIRHMSFIRHIA